MTPDVAQLQRRARKLLPPHVYDYYAGGSGRERTLRASEKAWRQVWLAPRVLRDVSAVDTATRLLGSTFATPLAVAPTGYQGLAYPDGELAAAAGAARAGALYVLSTRSTCRIEDVGEAVAAEGGTWWFQVYLMRDRDLTAGLVRRAAAAGAAALVLTADTPVVGRKRRNSADGVVSDEVFLVNLGPLDDLDAADQAADTEPGRHRLAQGRGRRAAGRGQGRAARRRRHRLPRARRGRGARVQPRRAAARRCAARGPGAARRGRGAGHRGGRGDL